jgi:HSP20 family protein
MAIVRWNPARELLTMRDQMDRMMEDAWGTSWGRRGGSWDGGVAAFPIDVYQTDKEYVVKGTLPGVKPEDLDVSIVGETLTIKATAHESQEAKEEDWLLRESRYSNYSRTVTLPSQVQADKVDASLENGVLTLRIPKAEAMVPKTIKVKPGK